MVYNDYIYRLILPVHFLSGCVSAIFPRTLIQILGTFGQSYLT
jgi:hypothetical protein